jgi:hypothetical protein
VGGAAAGGRTQADEVGGRGGAWPREPAWAAQTRGRSAAVRGRERSERTVRQHRLPKRTSRGETAGTKSGGVGAECTAAVWAAALARGAQGQGMRGASATAGKAPGGVGAQRTKGRGVIPGDAAAGMRDGVGDGGEGGPRGRNRRASRAQVGAPPQEGARCSGARHGRGRAGEKEGRGGVGGRRPRRAKRGRLVVREGGREARALPQSGLVACATPPGVGRGVRTRGGSGAAPRRRRSGAARAAAAGASGGQQQASQEQQGQRGEGRARRGGAAGGGARRGVVEHAIPCGCGRAGGTLKGSGRSWPGASKRSARTAPRRWRPPSKRAASAAQAAPRPRPAPRARPQAGARRAHRRRGARGSGACAARTS